MKLVMDEKLKHRLIGLAVIISLGAIFAPAVMRKSSQHLENNFSVNVTLPPKPVAPNVAVTDEKDLFKTIKIARVTIPSVPEEKNSSELVKAEPIKSDQVLSAKESVVAQIAPELKLASVKHAVNESAKKTVQLAAIQPVKKAVTVALKQKVVAKVAMNRAKPLMKQEVYAVQLASFSQLSNAQALVNRLHSKGYKASFTKTTGKQGAVYKVYAGHSPRKNEVAKLKTQLASAMQLNGFIVNTGVS